MDNSRLRYFVTVTKTGSLRKASDILHISTAALSKSIKQLEHDCGFKLLLPDGRGIIVTEHGKQLAHRAAPLLSEIESLPKLVLSSDKKNILRIGTFEVFSTYFLGPALKTYFPDELVALRESVPGEIERLLLDREIDIGISYIPIPLAGIDYLKITSIQMGIFIKQGTFKKCSLSEIPFVVPIHPVKGSPNKVQGLDGWPDHKLGRLIKYRVTLMESAMEICRQGLAAAYLPQFVVHLHNRNNKKNLALTEIKPPKQLGILKQDVHILKRTEDPEGKTIKKMARALRIIT